MTTILESLDPERRTRRTLDPVTRHRVMASIPSRNTAPELALRRALYLQGIRGYRCHLIGLPGKPDVAFTRWRLAVFVDGVWWHGHPGWFTPGRRGPYWDGKIAGNVARDTRVDEKLRALGWDVMRFWDVDILRAADQVAASIGARLVAKGRAAPVGSNHA